MSSIFYLDVYGLATGIVTEGLLLTHPRVPVELALGR